MNDSYQYQEPGAYLNGSSQSANTLNNNPNQTGTGTTPLNGKVHKDHPGLLNAVAGVAKAAGVGIGATAPLAGAYLMGRAMNPYGAMPMMGMPMMGMPMGMGYGMPYGMGGLSSFMHY